MFIIFQSNDLADNLTLSPHHFNCLGVPCPVEYISTYTLSVQTAYVTSCECMISSNNYIKTGIYEIDSPSNDAVTNLEIKVDDGLKSLEDMLDGLQTNQDQEMKAKFDSVVYMTVNYYKKKDAVVKDSGVKLGEVEDIKCAQSTLVAQRCESSYSCFISESDNLKSKYISQTSSIDINNINRKSWATITKRYYEAREEIVENSNVYASIRDTFMYGSGINLCTGSANTDEKLLVSKQFFIF